jgi:predicted PurR-regulated permease PerM
MPNFRRRRYRHTVWHEFTRGAPLAVFLATGLLILYNLLPVVELVAVALLLALVLRTTLRWLQKIFRVRWVAVMILVGLIGGFVLFIGLVVIPSFVQEAQHLSLALPKYLNSLIHLSRRLHNSVSYVPSIPRLGAVEGNCQSNSELLSLTAQKHFRSVSSSHCNTNSRPLHGLRPRCFAPRHLATIAAQARRED